MEQVIAEQGQYLLNRNAYVKGSEPMIFHCHHYNVFLQMSIEDTKEYIDAYSILKDSAQEVVYAQMKNLFKSTSNIDERKAIVEDHFRFAGFGLINLGQAEANGGTVVAPSEHYAVGWKMKFGLRGENEPGVSFFTCGFLAGAIEAIYDLPLGTMETEQTKCLSKGHDVCEFQVKKRTEPVELGISPGEGEYQTIDKYPQPKGTDVNYAGIREALINMPIEGSQDDGLINAFGVVLTRHYANYYALVSLRTMLSMEVVFGESGVDIVQDLLREAGHVCAFNTLGGIMESIEWDAMIKPMIKTKDDWAHGIVACCNAMGWGVWEIGTIRPEEQTLFRATSAYESNAFKKLYDENTNFSTCCFVSGAVAGIMNLIYHGDISQKPTLDEDYYNATFRSEGRFDGSQVKARSKGDEFDNFKVVRAKA